MATTEEQTDDLRSDVRPAERVGTVSDRRSFEAVTAGAHAVAALYAYARLDPLVDLACAAARDFFARPQLYTAFESEETPARLARLAVRPGSAEYYPSAAQRAAIFGPVFGAPEDSGDFARLRDGLLQAAAAYAEWSQATGIPMLRERVRTTHRPLHDYLEGLSGASVEWSATGPLRTIADEESYRVLREPGVLAVFGLKRPPDEGWPYVEDANGDKAVEQMSKQLSPPEAAHLTRERFSALQRTALRGAEALAAVLDFDETHDDDEELDELITRCYTWYAALRSQSRTPVPSASDGGRIA